MNRITWKEYYEARQKLQESLNINVGLFCLQRCIEALLAKDKAAAEGRSVHVPFGDSKLTLLLKDVLSGGARMTVLICASLEPRNAIESIQALRFGESCSKVETRAGRKAGAGAAALRKLVAEIDAEISEVQAIIVRDQRWEKRVTVRHDTVELKDKFGADGLGVGGESMGLGAQKTTDLDGEVDLGETAAGVMVVKTGNEYETSKEVVSHEVVSNVLVGAEEAEARLEALLTRKRALLGE